MLDGEKPAEDGNPSVPCFIRSMTPKPLTGKARALAMPHLHVHSPSVENAGALCNADASSDDKDRDDDTEVSGNDNGPYQLPAAESPTKRPLRLQHNSIGASALDLLRFDGTANKSSETPGCERRRTIKLKKYARMSLCVAVASNSPRPRTKRCYRLSISPMKRPASAQNTRTTIHHVAEGGALSSLLSFLTEGELLRSASLVCTAWADAAAEALGDLMLVSVGYDPSTDNADDGAGDDKESDLPDERAVLPNNSSVADSMRRDWRDLTDLFPWARFLSYGALKRVYKVWNGKFGGYEALSVMDVDQIEDTGNLNLVGSELAVSVRLSSLARRNICPNFVVTRGIFTCDHEPPPELWGDIDNAAPRGDAFDGTSQPYTSRDLEPHQCGNPSTRRGGHARYQYIRMELCQHGDVENFLKTHPEKMLTPWDSRNLLFQMAFALHVAGDRFGLKHYDVKLLNFFLQSAKDPKLAEKDHPHVVLRYGIGSEVFRLRMHHETAFYAKLADYGTSVTAADSDGQPVSLGQFTTLENTPPDFLILGNDAKQGYGHDCFGLGLCMLHLFTGHEPYEEILQGVICPENLRGKLRRIWKRKPHNVINSVMFDNNDRVEDGTLYDTLYRYLVLFGVPERQCSGFFQNKQGQKVWHAVNSTLLPQKGASRRPCPDIETFSRHRKEFSLADGSNGKIANARQRLLGMDCGAMELLLSLVDFDPEKRATPLDVINSRFMSDLKEVEGARYEEGDIVKSFTAYSTS